MEKKTNWGCIAWLLAPLGLFLFLYLQFGSVEVAWGLKLATGLLILLVFMGLGFFGLLGSGEKTPPADRSAAVPVAPSSASSIPPTPQTPLPHIEAMIAGLRDAAVQKEARECAVLCREILAEAEQNEEVRDKLDNFYRHYLPMFEQMVENYAKCEAAGVLPPSLTKQLTEFLDMMEAAMKKLKEQIYTNDIARLSVNMDVLETLYRTDGLLDDGLHAAKKETGETR